MDRIRITKEVLGGVWDALASDRVQLSIGAPGDGPAGGNYSVYSLGSMPFVFVVAPGHPLADYPAPIPHEVLLEYRAVAAADSSRNMPPRTANLLTGQDVLTMPDIYTKRQAHLAGLGVGSIPRWLAQADIEAGRLIEKQVEGLSPSPPLYIAWQDHKVGKALEWMIRELTQEAIFADLLQPVA